MCLLVVTDSGAIPFLLFGGGVGFGADVGGAEGFDAVAGAIRDHHVLTREHAVMLRRRLGRNSSAPGPAVVTLAISRPSGRMFNRSFAAQNVGFRELPVRRRKRLFRHHAVARRGHRRQHALLLARVEIHLHVPRRDGSFGCVRGVHQPRIALAHDLLRHARPIEIHVQPVGGILQIAPRINIAAVGVAGLDRTDDLCPCRRPAA